MSQGARAGTPPFVAVLDERMADGQERTLAQLIDLAWDVIEPMRAVRAAEFVRSSARARMGAVHTREAPPLAVLRDQGVRLLVVKLAGARVTRGKWVRLSKGVYQLAPKPAASPKP